MSTSAAFFLNQGYGQCAVLGEIRAYDKGHGKYHIFLKDQSANRRGWSKCTQSPIQIKSWRNIGNLMKLLTCHQIVAPEEFCRRYVVLLQDGSNGKLPDPTSQVVMSFFFSLACTSMQRKTTEDDKKIDYLEIVIDMEHHKKLTGGWHPSQNPRYVVCDIGLRVIGDIDPRNADLQSDPALIIKKEVEFIPSSDEEDEETYGTKATNRVLDLVTDTAYIPSPPPRQASGEPVGNGVKVQVDSFGFTNLPSSTPNPIKQEEGSHTRKARPLADQNTTVGEPPKVPQILAEATQSQTVQPEHPDSTKTRVEETDIEEGSKTGREHFIEMHPECLEAIMARTIAKDHAMRCTYCREIFNISFTKDGYRTWETECQGCRKLRNENPKAECELDHEEGWPIHCRKHHGQNIQGKIFKEVEKCKICVSRAWGTPSESSFFKEEDPQEEDSDDESVESDDYTDSDTHPCSPAEADMVLMVHDKVGQIKKATKRSVSTLDEIKDIALNLMEKIAKVEGAVDKIQEGAAKTQGMVNKVEERVETVINTLEVNTDQMNDCLNAISDRNKGETKNEATYTD